MEGCRAGNGRGTSFLRATYFELTLLMALAALIRGELIVNAEEVVLGRAMDLLDERHRGRAGPTVTDVVTEHCPDLLRSAARAASPHLYHDWVADPMFTLGQLCSGSLGGVFDGATPSRSTWTARP